ncbi:MAG: S49 family peptidase [Planctomycetota bacterium]
MILAAADLVARLEAIGPEHLARVDLGMAKRPAHEYLPTHAMAYAVAPAGTNSARYQAADGGVALMHLDGMIAVEPEPWGAWELGSIGSVFAESIAEVGRLESVRTMLIIASSPGGHAVTVEPIAQAITEVREQNPGLRIVAVTASRMNSAAYIALAGCDEVYCTRTGNVGAIGTRIAFVNHAEAMRRSGARQISVASDAGKAENVSDLPLGDDAAADEMVLSLARQVGQIHSVMRELVATGRKMTPDQVDGIGSEQFIGFDALDAGLVDGVVTSIPALVRHLADPTATAFPSATRPEPAGAPVVIDSGSPDAGAVPVSTTSGKRIPKEPEAMSSTPTQEEPNAKAEGGMTEDERRERIAELKSELAELDEDTESQSNAGEDQDHSDGAEATKPESTAKEGSDDEGRTLPDAQAESGRIAELEALVPAWYSGNQNDLIMDGFRKRLGDTEFVSLAGELQANSQAGEKPNPHQKASGGGGRGSDRLSNSQRRSARPTTPDALSRALEPSDTFEGALEMLCTAGVPRQDAIAGIHNHRPDLVEAYRTRAS